MLSFFKKEGLNKKKILQERKFVQDTIKELVDVFKSKNKLLPSDINVQNIDLVKRDIFRHLRRVQKITSKKKRFESRAKEFINTINILKKFLENETKNDGSSTNMEFFLTKEEKIVLESLEEEKESLRSIIAILEKLHAKVLEEFALLNKKIFSINDFKRIFAEENELLKSISFEENVFFQDLKKEIKLFLNDSFEEKFLFRKKNIAKFFSKNKTVPLKRSKKGNKLLVCPECLHPQSKILFDDVSEKYFCSRCQATFSKEEIDVLLDVEHMKGVLIDFSINKDIPNHLVLDHHNGLDGGDIMKTATTQVIDFIKSIRKVPSIRRFTLLRMYENKIKQFMSGENIHLFANHCDMDMVLANFAFRNPNTALKYEKLLKKLSLYDDIKKIDFSIKRYFLTIQGMIHYLEMVFGNKNSRIVEFIVKELKNVLKYPSRYKRFRLEELKRLKFQKNKLLKEFDKFFIPYPGYEHTILKFVKHSEIKDVEAIFEVLMEGKGGAFNNPLLINIPLIVRTDSKKSTFNLSVNPNRFGFKQINLLNLKKFILSAENEKIQDLIKESEKIIQIENEINLFKEHEVFKKLKELKKNIMKSDIKTIKEKLLLLIDLKINSSEKFDKEINHFKEEIKKIINSINVEKVWNKQEKINLVKNISLIEKNIFDEKIKEESILLEKLISKFPLEFTKIKGVNASDLKKAFLKHKNYLFNDQIWKLKPNLIINSPVRSCLKFDELMNILTSHLDVLNIPNISLEENAINNLQVAS